MGQIEASLGVQLRAHGERLAAVGEGVHAGAQIGAPLLHEGFVGELALVHGRHVDHLLEHQRREHPGLAVDDAHHLAVFADQVAQGLTAHRRGVVARVEGGLLQRQVGEVVLQGRVILDVGFLLALLDLVERRLGDIHMAAGNQLRHLPEEEGEQQGADVGAVHVRVGHDDDAVVAQFFHVVFITADPAAQCGNQSAYLLRGEHLVEAGFLHVENLTLQRQDRLVLPVAALLGGAARGITLHDVELGKRRVFFLAVRQLAGQAGDIQGALAAGHVAGLAGRVPGPGRVDDFLHDLLGFLGMLQQVILKFLGHGLLNGGLHLGGDQLVLGLAGELGIRHLHRNHRRQAFTGVVAGGVGFFPLEEAFPVHVVIQRAGQGGTETRQMRAAVALGNVVGEAEDVLLVGVIPLHGHFHGDAVFPVELEVEYLIERGLAPVEVGDEGTETAFVLKDILVAGALVLQVDAHAGVQEAQLAQPLRQDVVVELDIGEGLGRRPEVNRGAGAVRGAHRIQRLFRHAVAVTLLIHVAVAADGQLQGFGQGVDHGNAHAVQPPGDLVGVVVELTAGVQHGHDHLSGADTLFGVHVHGDAAAVVRYGDGFIRMDDHPDLGTVPGQGFVDGVIDHLENHVMQTGAVIRITDVHAGTFANGVQTLQHLNAG